MGNSTNILRGEIAGEPERFTLEEFCEACGLNMQIVLELVEHDIVDPEKYAAETTSWSFSIYALHRVQRAMRLRRDLEIDFPGLSLALDLLDEVDRLRDQVRRQEQQLQRLER